MSQNLEDHVREITEAAVCSVSGILPIVSGIQTDNELLTFIGVTLIGFSGFRYLVYFYTNKNNY